MTSPEDLTPEDIESIARATAQATDMLQWELEIRDKN